MIAGANLAEIASLVGEPSRANMLLALLDGRALTATELAFAAHVSPQTASEHLARLVDGRLLAVVKQGRFRYYRLDSLLVARAIESLSAFASMEAPPRHRPRSARDEALLLARTCYDHLAGRLGVALADALAARGHIVLGEDGGEVTEAGAAFLQDFGVDLSAAGRQRRIFCRPCLDWSERRPHLAGALGAALASRCFALGWIARHRDSRALVIRPSGEDGLRRTFGLLVERPSGELPSIRAVPAAAEEAQPARRLRTRSTAARQPA